MLLGHRANLRLEQHACRTTRDHERLVASHDAMTSRPTAPPADRYLTLRFNAKSRPFSSPKNMTRHALPRLTQLRILRISTLLGIHVTGPAQVNGLPTWRGVADPGLNCGFTSPDRESTPSK